MKEVSSAVGAGAKLSPLTSDLDKTQKISDIVRKVLVVVMAEAYLLFFSVTTYRFIMFGEATRLFIYSLEKD